MKAARYYIGQRTEARFDLGDLSGVGFDEGGIGVEPLRGKLEVGRWNVGVETRCQGSLRGGRAGVVNDHGEVIEFVDTDRPCCPKASVRREAGSLGGAISSRGISAP